MLLSLLGFGIRMTMDDFQIDGVRQDVTESLKSAVRYSIPLDPRCFRWKMRMLSGPKARVLVQLLIPLVTWSLVNATSEVKDFRLISQDTRTGALDGGRSAWEDFLFKLKKFKKKYSTYKHTHINESCTQSAKHYTLC